MDGYQFDKETLDKLDKPKIEFSRGDFFKYDNQRFVKDVKQA